MPSGGITAEVREARWLADAPLACTLLHGYLSFLVSQAPGVAVTTLAEELAAGGEFWSLPTRVMLIAFVAEQPAGCVCLLKREDRALATWEMKRLWVQPELRRSGAGRALLQAAIAWCRSKGANEVLLDTLPVVMPAAVALYRSVGFVETERHNASDIPGLMFMKLQVSALPFLT